MRGQPTIRIFKVTPQEAAFWGGSGTTLSPLKMAAAAFTSRHPDMGENRKVGM
jgi:hypothetical protein